MTEYNPEFILKYDASRLDDGGFKGEIDNMKRSDHPKAKPKLYAVAFNQVDVKFPFGKAYDTETRYGRRWIFSLVFANADPNKHELSIIDEEGNYRSSWFPPTYKFTRCLACKTTHKGKHVDKCDCGSENTRKEWACRTAEEFERVLNASGWERDRWWEFTYRMSVTLTDRGYARYHLDCIEQPSDAVPQEGRDLLAKPPETHFEGDLKEKLESLIVPVVAKLAGQGETITMDDWVATLTSKDIGTTASEAETLWEFRFELDGWPAGV